MGDIVVGIDGSEGGARALRWAVEEARLRGDTVTALLSWGYLDQHHADPAVRFDPDYGEASAMRAAEAAVAAAGVTDLGPAVHVRTVCDLPAAALADASVGADLLVVGSRGLGGFKGLLLGSVSDSCLSRSACPVVVVPTDGDGSLRAAPTASLVVGVDRSAGARDALRWAVDEALVRHATLHVVHAWQVPFLGMEPIAAAALEPKTFEQAGREVLDEALADVLAPGQPQPTIERDLFPGAAATGLLHAAATADLLVLGGRPSEGLARLTVGSTARQVLHHSPRPVVVVPSS